MTSTSLSDAQIIHSLRGSCCAVGWFTVTRSLDRIDDAEATLRSFEQLWGPLPQAECLEWPDGQALRVLLPPGSNGVLSALNDDVSPVEGPAQLSALDLCLLDEETLVVRGVVARMWYRVDDGEAVGPAWRRIDAPSWVVPLEVELIQAVRSIDLGCFFVSAQGVDTVDVLSRGRGRLAVRLSFPDAVCRPLDSEGLLGMRRSLLSAITRVIIARHAHPVLRLSPDVQWALSPQLTFVLPVWRVGVEQSLDPELSVETTCDVGLLSLFKPSNRALFLQLVPTSGADHEVVCATLRRVIGSMFCFGIEPIWLVESGEWVFCPQWSLPLSGVESIQSVHDALLIEPSVRAVRWVPGLTTALIADGRVGQWRSYRRGRWYFSCFEDGVTGRDWLEETDSRPEDAADHSLSQRLSLAVMGRRGLPELVREGLYAGRSLMSRDGRWLVAFHFKGTEGLDRLFALLGRLPHAGRLPEVRFARGPTQLVLHYEREA